MINFEKAREDALQWISRLENVGKVISNTHGSIWEISSEISFQNQLHDIQFQLFLERDFPLSLPRIFLSEKSFDKYKYIPHLDSKRFVCTYSDSAIPDISQPGLVVEEVIRKAKRIIVDGLQKVNYKDFEEEFNAYWTEKYEKYDKVLENVLLINKEPLQADSKLIQLQKPYSGYSFIIHQDEEVALEFKNFLNKKKIQFEELQVLFIGDLPLESPPFIITNKKSLSLIKENSSIDETKLTKYINRKVFPKAIIFSKTINGSIKYFGWFYLPPSLNPKGFRYGAITISNLFRTFNANDYVTRFSTEEMSVKRMSLRSAGLENQNQEIKFTIAGIGSIGSNLIHFLNSYQDVVFKLIDEDKLKVENIGRHLAGFSYVGGYKTKSVADILISKNPLQKVLTHEKSIVEVVQNDPLFVQDSDYIFIAIGKRNIELWVADLMTENNLTVPVFYIWVEPYLAGGHCIFMHPNNPNYNAYFDNEGLFNFNIISNEEYLSHNPKLSMREAGCQTTYVPYSANNTLLFLAALFPFIDRIIKQKPTQTCSFSWIGDLNSIVNMGISLNPFYVNKTTGQIFENHI